MMWKVKKGCDYIDIEILGCHTNKKRLISDATLEPPAPETMLTTYFLWMQWRMSNASVCRKAVVHGRCDNSPDPLHDSDEKEET